MKRFSPALAAYVYLSKALVGEWMVPADADSQ